jgi:hypothetical protein
MNDMPWDINLVKKGWQLCVARMCQEHTSWN